MSPIVPQERVEEVLEPFGGVEETLERLRQYEINWNYFEEHREELEHQYPDQWIGILHEQIAAHGNSSREVVEAVIAAYGTSSGLFRKYLSTEKRVWLL